VFRRINSVFLILLTLWLGSWALWPDQANAQRLGGKRRKQVLPTTEVPTGLPYQVIVGDRPAEQTIITLAVGSLTTILTPEAALQFHLGHREQLGLSMSHEKAPQHAIYLRPMAARPVTNAVIEMPSGNVSFFLRVIEVRGGAYAGQFNGEVLVKPPFYTDDLRQLTGQVTELDVKLRQAEQRIREAEKRATEAVATAGRSWDEGVRAGRFEGFVVLEAAATPLKKKRSTELDRVKITQISQLIEGTEGFFALFEVKNRSSRARKLERVEGDGGVKCSFTRTIAHEIAGRATLTVAVYIEAPAEPPTSLVFSIDSMPLRVPLQTRERKEVRSGRQY